MLKLALVPTSSFHFSSYGRPFGRPFAFLGSYELAGFRRRVLEVARLGKY